MQMADITPVDKLEEFEGLPVTGTTVAIVGAGDGLSAALGVAPVELPVDTWVTIVARCQVTDVRHPLTKPPKDDPEFVGVTRKHVLKASTVTLIDSKGVERVLNQMADRIRLAEEAKQGVQRLPITSEGDVGGPVVFEEGEEDEF